MLWIWILLAIAVLIGLLCWMRVGVWVAFGKGAFCLNLLLGPLRIHILPARKKPKSEEQKREKKSRKPKKELPEGKKKAFALEDVKDAFHSLLPPLGRALSRTCRGIRIKPLRVSLILGGQEDPAAAAEAYGKLQAVIWTGMPALERLVNIQDVHVYTDVDFTAPAAAVEGEVGAAFRVGTLLAVGFGMAFPALRWFLRWRKRCRKRSPEPDKKSKKFPDGDPSAKEPPAENPAA